MPNMGRVDYLHAMAWNWAYAGAVERLAEWSRRRMLTPEAGQPSHPDDLTFIAYRRRKVAITA